MYKFRREDTDEVVEVDFETMMGQDRAGYITLPDGCKARRVNDFAAKKATVDPANANGKPQPSDNLGCTEHQIAKYRADLERSGISGVEFRRDPTCETFYQVHFASHAARDAYIKHRGRTDMNKTAGSALTPESLRAAEEWASKLT